jgi:UrcA family protein
MNQKTQSNGSLLRVAAIVGIYGCMAGGSLAVAGSPSPNSAASSQLTLADLDLANPADVAVARKRIHQLARKLCDRVANLGSLSHQPDYVACIADAMAKAEPGLQRLAAEKVHETHLAELP